MFLSFEQLVMVINDRQNLFNVIQIKLSQATAGVLLVILAAVVIPSVVAVALPVKT